MESNRSPEVSLPSADKRDALLDIDDQAAEIRGKAQCSPEREVNTDPGFERIVGYRGGLRATMEAVSQVATTDSTVLLMGETGTGKDLIAREIRRLSSRRNNAFVNINCAAVPIGLLEGELFGYEKGAFTGAVAKRIGRLELAHRGTLFLDEVGDMPLELQPKLLRVLQDRVFERLGGIKTIEVDFRLVAATNQDLPEMVLEKQFRSDLYYRLNVFPIRIPPLRERREDIPLFIESFVQKHASRQNRSIRHIPAETMEIMGRWGWPGNVRELENFIERSIILTKGSVLQAPLRELMSLGAGKTLDDMKRAHIRRALEESQGNLSRAATRLGLARTTLQSKIKRLDSDHRMRSRSSATASRQSDRIS